MTVGLRLAKVLWRRKWAHLVGRDNRVFFFCGNFTHPTLFQENVSSNTCLLFFRDTAVDICVLCVGATVSECFGVYTRQQFVLRAQLSP